MPAIGFASSSHVAMTLREVTWLEGVRTNETVDVFDLFNFQNQGLAFPLECAVLR